MHYSTILATVSLATLSLAAPAPVQERGCTKNEGPNISRYLQAAKPDESIKNNDSTFVVSQSIDSNGNNTRINHALSFESIPPGATNCQLYVQFPEDFFIDSSENAALSVKTLYKDSTNTAKDIQEQAHWTWSTFYSTSDVNSANAAVGAGVFGTTTLEAGQYTVINSESCPVGGGNLAFIFEISPEVKTTEYVSYTLDYDSAEAGAGFGLSYDLNSC
jgi:hypothetical protein